MPVEMSDVPEPSILMLTSMDVSLVLRDRVAVLDMPTILAAAAPISTLILSLPPQSGDRVHLSDITKQHPSVHS